MTDDQLAGAAAEIRALNPLRRERARAICWLLFRAKRRVTSSAVRQLTELGSLTDITRDIDAWEDELRQAVAGGVPGVDLPEPIVAKLSTAVGEIMAMARDAARAEFDAERQQGQESLDDAGKRLAAADLAIQDAQDARQRAETARVDAHAARETEAARASDLERRIGELETALRNAQSAALSAAEEHRRREIGLQDEVRAAHAQREAERQAAAAEAQEARRQADESQRGALREVDRARLAEREAAAARERAEQRAAAVEEQSRAQVASLTAQIDAARAAAEAAQRVAAGEHARAAALEARLDEAQAARAALAAALDGLKTHVGKRRRESKGG